MTRIPIPEPTPFTITQPVNNYIFVYRDVFFRIDVSQVIEGPRGGGLITKLIADTAKGTPVCEWPHDPSLEAVRKACEEHIEGMISNSIHAGGDALCEDCEKPLRTHPYFRGARAFGDGGHYLRRRCDGRLVKL